MSKFDLYQTVTDKVIHLMQTHGAAWTNPFAKADARARNPITGKAYQGINQFLLATTPFASPFYAGFGQWRDKGCMVKRGSKATMIVFWKILERSTTVEGVTRITKLPLLRYLNVFSVEQVEGEYATKLLADATTAAPADPATVAADVDAFFAATGATVHHSDNARAFYRPGTDSIHMPNRSLFRATATSTATENYYSTLAHEFTHWTGHTSRLARDFSGRFGDEAYAFEELVAELGAAMLCAQLGVSNEPRADHAQYLNSWLKVLKSDNAAILKAATLAKQAAAYLSASAEDAGEEETAEAA